MPTRDDWRRGFAEPDLGTDDPRPTPTPEPGAVRYEGTDDHGVVTVTVDGSGSVSDVVIASTWRDTLAPDGLGSALRTAANHAFFSRLADDLGHADLEREPASASEPDGDPSGQPVASMVIEADDLIAQFDRDFGIYRDRLRAAADTAAATRRGINGRIEVAMGPGIVSAVTVDSRWAAHCRYTEIRAEALAAFQAAGRQAGTQRPDAVPLPGSLARIQELARDPRALSKQLGLS